MCRSRLLLAGGICGTGLGVWMFTDAARARQPISPSVAPTCAARHRRRNDGVESRARDHARGGRKAGSNAPARQPTGPRAALKLRFKRSSIYVSAVPSPGDGLQYQASSEHRHGPSAGGDVTPTANLPPVFERHDGDLDGCGP